MNSEKLIEQHKHEAQIKFSYAHLIEKSTTFGGYAIARYISNSYDLQTLVVFFVVSFIASISRIVDPLST